MFNKALKLCFERSGLPYSIGPERSYLYFESAFISWLQFISPSAKGINEETEEIHLSVYPCGIGEGAMMMNP